MWPTLLPPKDQRPIWNYVSRHVMAVQKIRAIPFDCGKVSVYTMRLMLEKGI